MKSTGYSHFGYTDKIERLRIEHNFVDFEIGRVISEHKRQNRKEEIILAHHNTKRITTSFYNNEN